LVGGRRIGSSFDRILILPVTISTIPQMQANRNAAHIMAGTTNPAGDPSD
jgi:hypothetical protein